MAFKKVETSQASYLKAAFFGTNGSGKTRSASELAIHLHMHIGSKKPIAFLDSETGSDYVANRFNAAGIQLDVDKSNAFSTLIADLKAAPKDYDILIIDSLSHYWRELMRAWKQEKRRTFISLKDWSVLKDQWNVFTTLYVNQPIHIILCGRSASVYEDVEEEGDDGKTEYKTVKAGTRFSAEGESGYEPSLLIEMTKEFTRDGGVYVRKATVIKERFGVIDGKSFHFTTDDKPGFVFQCFKPHIELLNLGGAHLGVDTSQNSQSLFQNGGNGYAERKKQALILVEEVEGLLTSNFPGQTAAEKKTRADVAFVAFGTRSWTAITEMSPERLRDGKERLAFLCKEIASEAIEAKGPEFLTALERINSRFVPVHAVNPLDDELPNHSSSVQ